jgi:hypothetical protein
VIGARSEARACEDAPAMGIENRVHVVGGMSNEAFLEAYAAPGRVGLAGGPSAIDKMIRRAQRKQRPDGSWSHWGHAFLFEGRRQDGKHWVLESDIDFHRERVLIGVQENRIEKYHDEPYFAELAVLDFGVKQKDVDAMIGVGLDLVARRTQYSLRELLATYMKLRTPSERASKNKLAQDRAMFCSAFVQHLFLEIGIDFADEVDTKLTTPEDIAQTKVPHDTYLLRRLADALSRGRRRSSPRRPRPSRAKRPERAAPSKRRSKRRRAA